MPISHYVDGNMTQSRIYVTFPKLIGDIWVNIWRLVVAKPLEIGVKGYLFDWKVTILDFPKEWFADNIPN